MEKETAQGQCVYKQKLNHTSDCVEFCPISNYENFCAVGTYQLDESIQKRVGDLYLFEVKESEEESEDSNHINVMQLQMEEEKTKAILDMKWNPYQTINNNNPVLATACSEGELALWSIENNEDSTKKKLTKISVGLSPSMSENKSFLLLLSLDWNSQNQIITSQTDCKLTLFSESTLSPTLSWTAHDYEIWISSFDPFNPSIIYSGSDDGSMKSWDLRTVITTDNSRSNKPLFIKKFEAGVTSITCHPTNEHYFASGGYDEVIRTWDKRNMKTQLTSTPKTGGGIWRLKWFPSLSLLPSHHQQQQQQSNSSNSTLNENTFATACMNGGFRIMQASQDFKQITEVAEYKGTHNSLAYGLDWSRGLHKRPNNSNSNNNNNNNNKYVLGSCSFYDSIFSIWTI